MREFTGVVSKITFKNEYQYGSLAWIERNNFLDARELLERLIEGETTPQEAIEELIATDSGE